MTNRTHAIHVMQYHLPNGRATHEDFLTTKDVWEKWKYLRDAHEMHMGAEILRSGEVSITIEDQDDVIDILITGNNPDLTGKIDHLIDRVYQRMMHAT